MLFDKINTKLTLFALCKHKIYKDYSIIYSNIIQCRSLAFCYEYLLPINESVAYTNFSEYVFWCFACVFDFLSETRHTYSYALGV